MTGVPYLMRVIGFGFRRPKVPVRGLALAGVVAAAGPGATRFRPGDEVFGICRSGSFAEYAVARADRLAPKPAGLSFEQAAALPVSALTALQAVRNHAKVQAGQRVLITGAGGGVGTFAAQFAQARGASVTGVCGPAKVDLVRSLGADSVLDYTREEIGQADARYDVIIDIAGNRPLARLRAFIARENVADYQTLATLVEAGALTPVIDRTYPLADAAEAIRHIATGHATGKGIITI